MAYLRFMWGLTYTSEQANGKEESFFFFSSVGLTHTAIPIDDIRAEH
jgi:hypothetical protein